MKLQKDELNIVCDGSKISFTGVMDFPEWEEIEEFFARIINENQFTTPVILDFKRLEYANSSAIRTLGNFVAQINTPLILYLNKEKTWQKMALKLLTSLQADILEIHY